jgi:hypothetical protein
MFAETRRLGGFILVKLDLKRSRKDGGYMFKAIKTAFNWVKGAYARLTTIEVKEVEVKGIMNEPNTVTVRDAAYWAEYSLHLQEQARIAAYFEKQEKLAKRLDTESIREWRENNRQLDEVLPKLRPVQKPRLEVVVNNIKLA